MHACRDISFDLPEGMKAATEERLAEILDLEADDEPFTLNDHYFKDSKAKIEANLTTYGMPKGAGKDMIAACLAYYKVSCGMHGLASLGDMFQPCHQSSKPSPVL